MRDMFKKRIKKFGITEVDLCMSGDGQLILPKIRQRPTFNVVSEFFKHQNRVFRL